jgi:hypothetical protein
MIDKPAQFAVRVSIQIEPITTIPFKIFVNILAAFC